MKSSDAHNSQKTRMEVKTIVSLVRRQPINWPRFPCIISARVPVDPSSEITPSLWPTAGNINAHASYSYRRQPRKAGDIGALSLDWGLSPILQGTSKYIGSPLPPRSYQTDIPNSRGTLNEVGLGISVPQESTRSNDWRLSTSSAGLRPGTVVTCSGPGSIPPIVHLQKLGLIIGSISFT